MLIAVPVSVGIALFVTQVAPLWLRRPIVYVTDLLAVVPSVVFGLWGVLVFSGAIKGFYGWLHDTFGSASRSWATSSDRRQRPVGPSSPRASSSPS